MSFKRKHVVAPSHSYVVFRDHTDDPDYFEVAIKKIENEDLRQEIYIFINENLDYERRGNHRYHLLAKSDLNHFLTEIENIEQGIKEDESEESGESDEEEDTDDELIQEALDRRLKSESTNSTIEEDHVSDSDMEDVISITRRLRHILKKQTEMERRISSIEKKL
jgi:hypothetical protein